MFEQRLKELEQWQIRTETEFRFVKLIVYGLVALVLTKAFGGLF